MLGDAFKGNVWTSPQDGVHCDAPDAGLIGRTRNPEVAIDQIVEGPKRNRLFISGAQIL